MKCTVQVTLAGGQGYLRIPGVQLEHAQSMLATARRHGQRAQLYVNLGRPFAPEGTAEPRLEPRTQPAR